MKKIIIITIFILIFAKTSFAQFGNIISFVDSQSSNVSSYGAEIKGLYTTRINTLIAKVEYSTSEVMPTNDIFLLPFQKKTEGVTVYGNSPLEPQAQKEVNFTLLNLESNTTYYYRVCLKDVFTPDRTTGSNYKCSSTKTFTTSSSNKMATNISNTKTTCNANNTTPTTDTSAELCGTATILQDIPGGVGYGYFRYSTAKIPPIFCNDIYGSNMLSTRESVLYPGNKEWKMTVTGLNPDTTYYYCSVVSNNTRNPSEIKYGGVASFRTLPCPTCEQKNIETKKITATNKTSASLRGAYNFTKAVNVYFEYQEAGRKINSDSILGLLGLGGVDLTSGASLGGTSTGRTNNNTGGSTENRGTNSIAQDLEIPASSIWKTTSKQNKSAGNNGDFSTNITGLKEGKRYLYRAVAEIVSTGEKIYGFTYDFTTLGSSSSGDGTGDGVGYGNDGWTSEGGSGFGGSGSGGSSSSSSGAGSSSGGGGSSVSSSGNSTGTLGGGVFGSGNNTPPPAIGQMGNPSSLSLVGNTEGIENVFIRQIMGNSGLARRYGYREGADLQAFAQNLAHTFAQAFGYVSLDGREVRVIVPNKAAYEIGLVNNILVIYEFFDNKLTGIATTNGVLKTPTAYEYYFNKR